MNQQWENENIDREDELRIIFLTPKILMTDFRLIRWFCLACAICMGLWFASFGGNLRLAIFYAAIGAATAIATIYLMFLVIVTFARLFKDVIDPRPGS